MRHFVADHRTDRAIVVGRIRRRIEEWRLQDRRRKHDFVLQRVVIRIDGLRRHRRSEEHTSELQSLMRISYAVFCLKKKISALTTQHKQQQKKQELKTHNN